MAHHFTMDIARSLHAMRRSFGLFRDARAETVPDAVYRELVSTLFSMRGPIIGLGLLYAMVGYIIYSQEQDAVIALLSCCAAALTGIRVLLINAYFRVGGSSQGRGDLKRWEQRYARATYLFALLLAGLNARGLTVHQPLIHMTTISLVFTFGAGIVSRTAGRPRICVISIILAVVPTVLALLYHAWVGIGTALHAELFALQAFLLAIVAALSLGSVRHLYRSSVEHLTTKHDLSHMARFDPLTGLANRLSLREAFQEGMSTSISIEEQLAVHYLDLDGFKPINDSYGHPTGDAVLCEVSRRLEGMVRSGDTVSRLGGDEFLVVQAGVQHPDQAEMLARRIIKQLSEPYSIDGMELRISVSIGVAMAPALGTDLEHLMACADAALYCSKARGKAQFQFYTAEDAANPRRAVA